MIKASRALLSLSLWVARFKTSRSRLISLLTFTLFLSGVPGVQAQAAGEIDIASVKACSVSLKSVWEPYGIPHPCFTAGSLLKIKVPQQRNASSSTRIILNGEAFPATANTYFVIPRYNVGLNEVLIQVADGSSSEYFEIKNINFIIYQPAPSLRLRTLVATKNSYVMSLAAGITPEQIVAALGLSSSEYIVKGVKGSEASVGSKVLVADLSEGQYSLASANPFIEKIFLEGLVQTSAVQTNATWGLDRIDQVDLPLNSAYKYDYSGTGVDIYIVDSGIREDHSEFAGRITATMFANSFTSVSDCHGHGTHVAGTAAGTIYGVAKNANIIPIKVLGCDGQGTFSDIQSGINWIIGRHTTGTPAVANFSLGSNYDAGMNNMMQPLIDDGVVTVVAAGNDADDACAYSPSSAPNVITVGATTNLDQDSWFSNIGSCVDIFAPGTGITSAGIASTSATLALNGTSMASPHVAGAAALVLQKYFATYANKLNANALVRETLLNNAIPEVLRDSSGYNLWWSSTTNKLLNTENLSSEPQATLQITNNTFLFQKNEDINLTASGGSGSGGLIFKAQGYGCAISGSILRISLKRICGVTVLKASDETFTVAQSAYVTFSTEQPQAALSVSNTPSTGTVGTPVSLATQGGSGTGVVTYSAVSGSCRVINGKLVAYGEGPCGVVATKAPDDTYIAKSSDTSTFTISGTLTHGPWKSVAVGGSTTCAITKISEKLYCWGLNSYGQLTIPVIDAESTTAHSTPHLIEGIPGKITSASIGSTSICAVNEYSNLYCWGGNAEGQLGNGSTLGTHVPESISALSGNVQSISVGLASACAITRSNSAFCWGSGVGGRLGNETTTSSLSPIQVSGLTSNVTDISVGIRHACAIQGGAVKCWGDGTSGALGDGLETASASPRLVTGLTSGFAKVAAGYDYSCAINATATYCWGSNASGALGDGTTTNRINPVAVADSVTAVSSIKASFGTTCAVTISSSLFCWGYNSENQVGINLAPSANQLIPAQVLGLGSKVIDVAPGLTHTCATTNYGRVFCWGDNTYGQLGHGDTNTSQTIYEVNQLDYNLAAPYIPTIADSTTTISSTSFGIQITNYDSNFSWRAVSSNESATATVNSLGVANINGLSPTESSTVTVFASKAGYETGTTSSVTIATMARGLVPLFDTSSVLSTADGFEINLANYDSNYQWSAVSSRESATVTISNVGRVIVSGISPGTSSTVTVTSSKVGISDETSRSLSYTSILGQGLLPIFDTSSVVATSDGFRIRISNYSNTYSWIATSSYVGGSASVDGSGIITVTGLPSSTPSNISVTSQRSGYESLTATSESVTSMVAPAPPAPAPAPAPSVGGGGGGGVGTTWFNLFVSSPDDPMLVYSGDACAIFILKADDGDKQFGPFCASKTGSLDYEANDGTYLIRTFDKSSPKYFKEYKAKVTFGTFEVTGAGYRGGSVPRRVITVLKPSEYPVEAVVAPTPAPVAPEVTTLSPSPVESASVTSTPVATPVIAPTMANNGLISTIAKSSTTKKVTLTSAKTYLLIKKSATLALTVSKIPAKSSLVITVTLPTGEKFTAATFKSYAKNSYSMPALAFSESGKFIITFKIGKSVRTVTIKVN